MIDVLYLCEFPALNGGEQSLLSVLEPIGRAGFRIAVAAPASGPLAEELASRRVRHLPLRLRDPGGTRLSQTDARQHLRELLSNCRPRLLHANSLAMSRLSGPVCRELGLPSVGHLRDMLKLSAAAVADLNCHTRLIAVSQATRDYHLAQGLDAERTLAIYNGVDLGRFQPRDATGYLHRELGLPANAPLIGCIGQMILRKGQDVAADAAARLAAKFPQLHWLFVGQRHSEKKETVAFEQQLRARFSTTPLDGKGHFLGTRTDVPQLLSELTLLIHAARQEPLGRVLIEAAATGVPVVATDVGGTAEIFGRHAACLVPSDDPAAMATAIDGLLNSPAERRQLATAARCRAVERFNATRAACELEQVYRRLVASP